MNIWNIHDKISVVVVFLGRPNALLHTSKWDGEKNKIHKILSPSFSFISKENFQIKKKIFTVFSIIHIVRIGQNIQKVLCFVLLVHKQIHLILIYQSKKKT